MNTAEVTMTDAEAGDEGPPGWEGPATSVNAAVGRTLRELRELKGITARDLAQRAGISAAMVSRIETGQVSPSLSVLEMIAGALEVPIAGLFRDTGSAVGAPPARATKISASRTSPVAGSAMASFLPE